MDECTSFFSIDPFIKNCSDKKVMAFLINSFFLELPLTDIEFPLV